MRTNSISKSPTMSTAAFKFPNSLSGENAASLLAPQQEIHSQDPSNLITMDAEHVNEANGSTPVIDIPPLLEINNRTPPRLPMNKTDGSTGQNLQDGGITPETAPSPHHAATLITSESSNHSVTEEYVTNLRQRMATDWKSPSEYALHILFTKFVRHAENKLNLCLKYPIISEPPIVDILGEGVDPIFDKIIESLGHIAKKKPKPVIDAMMFWRKTKSELANAAAEVVDRLLRDLEYEHTKLTSGKTQSQSFNNVTKTHSKTLSNGSRISHKRNNSSKSSVGSKNILEMNRIKELDTQIHSAKQAAFQADRKSLISIFILCRVLIETVKQTPKYSDKDLSDKLEEIVFTQLKTTDPMSISSSIIKSSNWNSFAELLGWMSEKKFLSVSDRFISDLEKLPRHISSELEPGAHLLILGMRYLRLKNYPLEKFEESADFMKSISKFFLHADNLSVKLAYAEVISQLLLPLAGSLTAEVNNPTWVEAMSTLLDAASKLQTESKYWASGFRLMVSVLCTSPADLFSENWIPLIEKSSKKIKNKDLSARVIFVVGLSRLVWVYLYRCTDTLNNTTRTLTKIMTLYLSSKRKESWITADLELINPLSDVLVTVGYAHPGFLLENTLIPLIRRSFNGSSLDAINYEKLILAISTYRALLMTNKRPEFPENDSRYYELGLNDVSIKQNETLSPTHEEICGSFYKLFLLLDSNIGSEVWSPENQHNKQPATPFEKLAFSFSNESNTNINRNLNIALFATLIETIPSCLCVSSRIPFKSTIEIVSRNAVHADLLIAASCQNALKALASKKNPYTLITWFAKYSFDFDEKTQSSYNMSYLSSIEYRRLLILYVELLECWLEEFQSSKLEEKKRETGLDGIQLMPIGNDPEESNENKMLEWKNTVTVIEEVEGNGLFFLCSQDPAIRKLGIQILRIISKFDEAMVEKTSKESRGHSRSSSHFAADRGTRLVDLLSECDYQSLLERQSLTILSDAEKDRITKLNSRCKKGILIKLAESEYGVDAALWQRVFPKLLSIIFDSCPVTMALCRSIVCIRLVQVHEIVLQIANNGDSKIKDVLPETIVGQWKLFLIVACTSLTSTGDQKLHIPTVTMQHGRKKSQQIFTVQHQKIKSATSIFKMVLPLLNAKHNIIKDAIIVGLSSMNINIYRAYLENVEKLLTSWKIDSSSNQIRLEMFHILAILSRFLHDPIIVDDVWILAKLSEFIKHAKHFLEEDIIQSSFEFQPLRSYFADFLKEFYLVVQKNPSLYHLFPFQARASCFNYFKEWCGYGECSYIGEERYAFMIKNANNQRDRTAIAAGIEFQKSKLQVMTLETMVVLCSSPFTQVLDNVPEVPIIVSFDTAGLLAWIEALFLAEENHIRELGVQALTNVLNNNRENVQFFRDVTLQCISHHSNPSISSLYYTTLCKNILEMEDLILEEEELVSLGLCGIIASQEETRFYAVDLLCAVETKLHNSSYTKVFKERLSSSSRTVFIATAKEITSIFAELLPQDLSLKIFSNIVRVLLLFPPELKKYYLTLLVPWVSKFCLKAIDDIDTFMVLSNLFYITIELNHRLPMEVEQLWISLGKGNSFQNIHVSLEYIITMSINHRNPRFVQIARDVVLYLANVPGSIGLVNALTKNLNPKSIIPITGIEVNEPKENDKYSFVANIWDQLHYRGKTVTFSRTHLSIIFLVNLSINPSEFSRDHIPSLVHITICLLDHYMPLIRESASRILCDIIYGLNPTHEKTESTICLLKDKKRLWSYDNLMKDRNGARSPKEMDSLIRNIIAIFSEEGGFHNNWQRTSLKWATTCSVRHIACRSFQVFRSLLTFLDQEMLRDMLHRLSNTISDTNHDIHGFAMQILMTLNAITAELDPADLINFPQLFWSITACLSSVHEQEFIEVLSCFTKFISKIDLDSPDTVQCLVATFPSNWEGRFDGLQQIVMTGLRSSNSADITWKFLDKLNLLKDSRIIANSDTRLLFALIANLPRFLHALARKEFTNIQTAVDAMISLSDAYNQPSLSRLIDSLSKNKFRSKRDFMSQVVSFISRNYFPTFSAQTLVFLLGLLLNKLGWVKEETMEILKYILPLVDLKESEFTGVGADLISPLLRLLLTEYECQALEVLDFVPAVSGSKLDKDVLRICMGNREIRNGSNANATLFGIPEESGWSVSMPTMTAATTRHNVHAVFMTCIVSNAGNDSTGEPPEMEEIVEFHADTDYGLERMETNDSLSLAEEKDASLSHMWAELDNLDSFFTKNTASASTVPAPGLGLLHGRSNSTDTTRTEQTATLESAPQLYDKKVSAILNRSLTKMASNVSFKTYLADSFAVDPTSDDSINEISIRNSYQSPSLYNEEFTPRSRNSNILKSPSNTVLGAVTTNRLKTTESPQDSLFRFEGFLRGSQRAGSNRKWQYQQQHQQLLSQTIHEQTPQTQYDIESSSSPIRACSASPVLALGPQNNFNLNNDMNKPSKAVSKHASLKQTSKQVGSKQPNSKQGRYQKHYHLPHFSSNKAQGWASNTYENDSRQ